MVASYNQTTTVMSVGDSCFWNFYNAVRKRWAGNALLGSFENSYIPENSSNFLYLPNQTKLNICIYAKKFCTYAKFMKKKSFFRKFVFATGLVFERFLAARVGFFEKIQSGQPSSSVLLTATPTNRCPDTSPPVRTIKQQHLQLVRCCRVEFLGAATAEKKGNDHLRRHHLPSCSLVAARLSKGERPPTASVSGFLFTPATSCFRQSSSGDSSNANNKPSGESSYLLLGCFLYSTVKCLFHSLTPVFGSPGNVVPCVAVPEHPTVCRLEFRFRNYSHSGTTAQKSISIWSISCLFYVLLKLSSKVTKSGPELTQTELAEERTEDHDTSSSQPRRSDRGGLPYDIL
ncbi:hypothetical protein LXL04_020210 [Taraxacum kok-saghyz]